jgi:hypothetical protein
LSILRRDHRKHAELLALHVATEILRRQIAGRVRYDCPTVAAIGRVLPHGASPAIAA